MADVSTYRRATVAYFAADGIQVQAGEIRPSTDPAVSANPAYWVALTDADIVGAELIEE